MSKVVCRRDNSLLRLRLGREGGELVLRAGLSIYQRIVIRWWKKWDGIDKVQGLDLRCILGSGQYVYIGGNEIPMDMIIE